MTTQDRIGGLNYKLSSEVSGFQKGMVLSRSEMNMTRKSLRDSASDTERLQTKLDTLERAYQAGAVTAEEYDKAVLHTVAQSREAKEAAAAQAAELERVANRTKRREELLRREREKGRDLTRSLETATERYQRELRDLDKQLRRGAITQETHRRATARARGEMRRYRLEAADSIPIVGRLTGLVGAMPARYIAAGAAITGAVGSLFAFGRAVRFVSDRVGQQMDVIDRQAKIAARLGARLEGLIAIRLAAAEVSGLEASAVDMGLQRMTRRVAEAAQGLGEARDVLNDLGFDARRLARQDPAEIFKAIADRVAEIKDPAEQVRVAFKLFDSEGVGFVNLLRLGGDAIEEYDRAARSLGVSLSSIDAAQVEQANDSLGRLGLSLDGVFNRLAVDVGPALTVVTSHIQIANLAIGALQRSFGSLGDRIATSTERLTRFGIELGKTKLPFGLGNFLGANPVGAVFGETAVQGQIDAARKTARESAKARADELERARGDNAAAVKAENEQQAEHAKKIGDEQKRATKERIELERKAAKEREAAEHKLIESAKRRLDGLLDAGERMRVAHLTPFEQLVERLRDAGVLLQTGAIHQETFAREVVAARDEFRRSARRTTAASNRAPSISRGSEEHFQEVARVLSEATKKSSSREAEMLAAQRGTHAAVQELRDVMRDLEVVQGHS